MEPSNRYFYGYGYYISHYEANTLPHEKYNDEFIHCDYTYELDRNSQSGFFFGLVLDDVLEGTCAIPENGPIDFEKFIDVIEKFKGIFGRHPGTAHHYIINQVF